MRPKLILVAGKADKREVRLKLPTIVGRTRDAGLMIAHKTVSRRHCELFERHGMLFVRDTGSRNGTLVDDAPVKESMVKPGHTLTVGPLTFRAEYEPADSFIRADDVDPAAAATIGSGPDVLPEMATDTSLSDNSATKVSDTPGELEFEEFGADDLGELSLPDESSSAPTEALSTAGLSAAASSDDEFTLDDNMAVEFDLDETGPAPVASSEEEEVSLEFIEDAAAEKPAVDLPDLNADDDVAFDLDAPAAGGGDAMPEISLEDDNDLGFDMSAFEEEEPKAAAPAAAAAEEGEELSFTLEDLEEGPSLDMPAAAEASSEEEVEAFEIVDEPKPAAKPAKAAAGKGDAAKVQLGQEKSSGKDSEMSAFMKELGL